MSLRIDPDGTVTHLDAPALEAAHAVFDHSTVVLLHAPFLTGFHVGIVDDFGAADLPINRKAWALYGGSPIYGPMFVGSDATGHVDPTLAELIERGIDKWGLEPHTIRYLQTVTPERPPMVAERPA